MHSSMRGRMPTAAVVVAVAGLAAGARAQWGTSPSSNFRVADRTGDQIGAQIAPTPDGGCYISWFDNSASGYDVYLQRLSATGVEQWPHNGVLLCNRLASGTVHSELMVDSAGNAVLAYTDDTVEATPQISVSRVSPAGTILWKRTVTTGSVGKRSPQVCQLSDGSYVVGSSNSAAVETWTMQRLNSAGVPQWAGQGITISEASRFINLSDLKPSGTGVAALWVRASGTNPVTSSIGLYAQKYNTAGAAQWNAGSPVIVFSGTPTTTIQTGYLPPMLTDGVGGVVIGWVETSGVRNAYIQHVLSTGALKFPAPVPNTGSTPTRVRVGAALAYNTATGEYYLASRDMASGGGTYGIMAQRFDGTGARLWGDTGHIILSPGLGGEPSSESCHVHANGCMVFFLDTRGAFRIVDAAKTGTHGGFHKLVNDDATTDKAGLVSAMSTQGFGMMAYQWGAGSAADIAVQSINPEGSLGDPALNYGMRFQSATQGAGSPVYFRVDGSTNTHLFRPNLSPVPFTSYGSAGLPPQTNMSGGGQTGGGFLDGGQTVGEDFIRVTGAIAPHYRGSTMRIYYNIRAWFSPGYMPGFGSVLGTGTVPVQFDHVLIPGPGPVRYSDHLTGAMAPGRVRLYPLGSNVAVSGNVVNPGEYRFQFTDVGTSGLNAILEGTYEFTICYANCDDSTAVPILTPNDFQCFLNAFAAGSSYANCDLSVNAPVLTANDFQCFLNAFAGGCQ